MTKTRRLQSAPVAGSTDIITSDFVDFLVALDTSFRDRVMAVRQARAARLERALCGKEPPQALAPSEATSKPWYVPAVPDRLRAPGIEISGPASIASMMVQALNPGPDGVRAVGYLD